MRYFLLGKVIDQLPLLCFSISIENLSLRSSLHHLTTSSQFLSSPFPLGQSKFSNSQFSTRFVELLTTSVNSVSQSRIEIFSLRRDMIFHLFLNDSLVKATFGSSVREKSIVCFNSTEKFDITFSGCKSIGADDIMTLRLFSISGENNNRTHDGSPRVK